MTPGFESPDAAEAAFYSAFAATDLHAMSQVWVEGEAAACVHPGGALLEGKDAVMQSWAEILTEASPPRIEYRLIRRMQAAELQIHVVEERIQASGKAEAAPNLVIATNVYTRGPHGWCLSLHHSSLPLMPTRAVGGSERRLH
jgi:hypothetical protein